MGALLVGVATAKALAFAADKPLIGVHHIEGHICANFLVKQDLKFPLICLVVSGGLKPLKLKSKLSSPIQARGSSTAEGSPSLASFSI